GHLDTELEVVQPGAELCGREFLQERAGLPADEPHAVLFFPFDELRTGLEYEMVRVSRGYKTQARLGDDRGRPAIQVLEIACLGFTDPGSSLALGDRRVVFGEDQVETLQPARIGGSRAILVKTDNRLPVAREVHLFHRAFANDVRKVVDL